MSDVINPIQPVARIEPINPILGVGEMDPGLYQIAAASLVALFQRRHPNDTLMSPSLPFIPLVEIIQFTNKYRGRKKYSKKNKRDFQKISSLFKKTFDQT